MGVDTRFRVMYGFKNMGDNYDDMEKFLKRKIHDITNEASEENIYVDEYIDESDSELEYVCDLYGDSYAVIGLVLVSWCEYSSGDMFTIIKTKELDKLNDRLKKALSDCGFSYNEFVENFGSPNIIAFPYYT